MFFNYFIFASIRTSNTVYLGRKKDEYLDNKKNTQRKEKYRQKILTNQSVQKMKPEF